jgi:hypothetical protein
VKQVVTRVLQPPKGRKKWSTRSMAEAVGVSHQSVHRIWKENELKPHLRRSFKSSNDPQLERKFWDVIGLYLNPPNKAMLRRKGPVPGAATDAAWLAFGNRSYPYPD